MKFLLDESTEFRLASWLASQGHDVAAIAHDYPRALRDHEVLSIAHREGRVLIANDRDFGNLVFRQRLPHAGVIFFRMKAASAEGKIGRLSALLASHSDHLDSFIVVTDKTIRVRRS